MELLGRHAGVPYWVCLSRRDTDARQNSAEERAFVAAGQAQQVAEAQAALVRLGFLPARAAGGVLDAATRRAIARFQAEEGLIASGVVDFDLIRHLRQRLAGAGAEAGADGGAAGGAPATDDGYRPLPEFLDPGAL